MREAAAIFVALRVRLLRHDHPAMLRDRILPYGRRSGLAKFQRMILGVGGHAAVSFIHAARNLLTEDASDHRADGLWVALIDGSGLRFGRRADNSRGTKAGDKSRSRKHEKRERQTHDVTLGVGRIRVGHLGLREEVITPASLIMFCGRFGCSSGQKQGALPCLVARSVNPRPAHRRGFKPMADRAWL